jgi:hypothetical protein
MVFQEGGFFMKKGKLLFLALIALVLTGGLVLASCGLGCEGYWNGDGKGRCFFRLSGGYSSNCVDNCIDEQLKKQGPAVDLNCNC